MITQQVSDGFEKFNTNREQGTTFNMHEASFLRLRTEDELNNSLEKLIPKGHSMQSSSLEQDLQLGKNHLFKLT